MANSYDLEILQGSAYGLRLTLRNDAGDYINLSGYNARGYVRSSFGVTGVLIDLAPIVHTSYVSGIIDIALTAAQTNDIPITQGVYDIEVYNEDGYSYKYLNGYVDIVPQATR